MIGHSAGGAFLVRWLGETRNKIKKLILVSPGKAGKGRPTLDNLYGDKTYKNLGRFVKEEIAVYTANDDYSNHIEGAKEYSKELPARVIYIDGYGHFSERYMGKKEFPELLEKILE